MGAHSTTTAGRLRHEEGRRHEVLGIVTGAATVLLTLSLVSYDARGGDNWIGPVGTDLAGALTAAFGLAVWLFPIECLLATLRFFSRRTHMLGLATMASTLVLLFVGCALLHVGFPGVTVFGGHLPGGWTGELFGEVLRSFLGLVGTIIVGTSILLITFVLRTSVSLVSVGSYAVQAGQSAARRTGRGMFSLWEAWREAKMLEQAEREAVERATAPRIVEPITRNEGERTLRGADATPSESHVDAATVDEDVASDEQEDEHEEAQAQRPTRRRRSEPKIVAPTARPAKAAPATTTGTGTQHGPFVLPPTTLLDPPSSEEFRIDEETLRQNALRLVEKLNAYGVKGRVDEIHPGPVVTMYEVEPQSGTKVSKISGLADDLAMALAAQKVRIVAPIPGKARVGFELPNEHRQTVSLREILEDDRWQRMKASLPIALGKDISGQPVYMDLAKMPHLLVAGATGSGKSVGLNVMLASLLAKKTPEEVRMLMIDPKVVELAVFDRIPHMLLPVVTDMKKAARALRWAVDEMERRYQLFADAGARNIASYNERVERVLRGELAPEKLAPSRAGKVRAQGPNGEEVLVPPDEGEDASKSVEQPTTLPFVVVVVDEFADLMMVAAKDVEACVARLAQKARAAGIHVILATQRPSVDVITGMIKANFPSRIAFKVSQREDSKTILGRSGAEHLLGMGDMLMIPPGTGDLRRVHCAYISEEEVKGICDYLRAQGSPVYDDEILKPRDDEPEEGSFGETSDDPLYDRAVAIVAQAGYCSISHIQRQLSVGYNKAAKLVERMETEGVVGPPSGKAGGRREVLVQQI